MKKYLLVAIITFFTVTNALAGPLEDAEAFRQNHDYQKALQLLKPLAEKGDPKAQYALGNMYRDGEGVTQNRDEALKWYNRAGDQGYVPPEIPVPCCR